MFLLPWLKEKIGGYSFVSLLPNPLFCHIGPVLLLLPAPGCLFDYRSIVQLRSGLPLAVFCLSPLD